MSKTFGNLPQRLGWGVASMLERHAVQLREHPKTASTDGTSDASLPDVHAFTMKVRQRPQRMISSIGLPNDADVSHTSCPVRRHPLTHQQCRRLFRRPSPARCAQPPRRTEDPAHQPPLISHFLHVEGNPPE